jgi:uncharacterized protein YqeY
MSLKQTLMQDMKLAMRAHEAEKLSVVRFLLSAIKNAEIDKGSELNDEEIQKIVAKQIKQVKDAIEQFKAGNRDDLVVKEKAKIAVLQTYLPTQLSDEELAQVVEKVMGQIGEIKNPGQVIGLVMKQVAGRADGGRVSRLVAEKMKAN